MTQPQLNANLFGCPLYRKLMPNKWEEHILEAVYTLVIVAIDFGAVWLIEGRTIHDNVDIAQNIGLYVILFCFTMMFIFLEVHSTRQARQENKKRAERLAKIPEKDFWELDAEVSISELQYGSFYFLKDYLYAPQKRLLIPYREIDTWKFNSFFSVLSGELKYQFLDITEKDGFKTQILIRQRGKLVKEHDKVMVKLDYYIRKAKYPNGSPYQK